jgi:hypothetical protein
MFYLFVLACFGLLIYGPDDKKGCLFERVSMMF